MTSRAVTPTSQALAVYKPRPTIRSLLEKAVDDTYRRSFEAQRADYGHFHRDWMGDVVVLVGTSTAGKTSIIRSLRAIEKNRVEDGGDLRCDVIFLKHLKKHCPNETALLENLMNPLDIPRAVFSKERLWKRPVSHSEKMIAEKAIQAMKQKWDLIPEKDQDSIFKNMEFEMVDDAFEHSRQGRSIIFDVLSIDTLARHTLTRGFDGPMRPVLVYCPFYALSSRMKKRNEEAQKSGNLSDQRLGTFPLDQFSKIYTQKKSGARTFETITREIATKTFDENFDIMVAHADKSHLPSPIQIERDKAAARQKFLDNLGFTDGIDRVEIAPRDQHLYSLIINTEALKPQQSAELIHRGTAGRL